MAVDRGCPATLSSRQHPRRSTSAGCQVTTLDVTIVTEHGVTSAVMASAVERAAELARRGDGDVIVLDVAARDQASGDRLREAFAEVRLQEWAEFEADCEKFEAEIAKEIRIEKYTLAELDEEEQSLDRLRRWYRDLKARDVLELPEAAAAEQRLKACTELLDDYADRVYRVLHGRPAAGGSAE